MQTELFSYNLPKELIARYPLERGMDRLLVVDRKKDRIFHRQFRDLLSYLYPGDVLVLNDTKVIPARLTGRKITGGQVEVLLLKQIDGPKWRCLVSASKPTRVGTVIIFEHYLEALVEERQGEYYVLRFSDGKQVLNIGKIPLPPYIDREPEEKDSESYQTVYAHHEGSVASPTAGLHFNQDMLGKIESSGIDLEYVTLHIGPGTFTPVRSDTIEQHTMHPEEFSVTEKAASAINNARAKGKRIVSVGTTTTRVLEHLIHSQGRISPGKGSTDIFIFNGFSFKSVGALLTNFHLPCSTLLMLVSAFGGHDRIMKAYEEAIERRYRFYSYGDAMLII
jgi:S-adenosylmethionine:tRNA ribosyltransferase-isomerase